jgi:GxxExxY protein
LIIELKAVQKLKPCDFKQLEKYLSLTGIKRGILVNFGSSELEYFETTNTHMEEEEL